MIESLYALAVAATTLFSILIGIPVSNILVAIGLFGIAGMVFSQ